MNRIKGPGFIIRYVAFGFFDLMIWGVVTFTLYSIILFGPIRYFSLDEYLQPNFVVLISLYTIGLAVYSGYYIYFHGKYGATIGKMVFKMKVVNNCGSPIDYKIAAKRFLLFNLSLFLLGVGSIWIMFDSEKQALYDKMLRLKVIYTST